MQALNLEGPLDPVAPFSESNDAWLANSVKEARDKSAEYAKLRTEESRQQWETLTRNNQLRDRENADVIKSRVETDQSNTRFRDEQHFKALAQEAMALMPQLAQYTNPVTGELELHRMPADVLRQYSTNQQELKTANDRLGLKDGEAGPLAARLLSTNQQPQVQPQVQQPQAQQKPETFPDGTFYRLTKNSDGTIQVNLPTGEVFTGDPIAVTEQLAKSKVHTTAWARQKIAQAQQSQPQVQQAPKLPAPINDEVPQSSFGEWAADEQAKALGFRDRHEMIQWGTGVSSEVEEMRSHRLAADFLNRNPDYPATPEAERALTGVIEQMGWDYSADTMAAAHAYAVRNGMYQPLTVEQQRASLGVDQPQNGR